MILLTGSNPIGMHLSKDTSEDQEEEQVLKDCKSDLKDSDAGKCEVVIAEDTTDADLDRPALQRRPRRNIKPVMDKQNMIKLVDSEDDSDDEQDGDWEVQPGDMSGDEHSDDDQEEGNSSDEESDGKEEGGEDVVTEEEELDNVDKEGDMSYKEIEVSMENEEEQGEPVKISASDMPFLFVPRGAGKRQIKVIQFKNEIAEQAKAMSDESSSEDEEWQAKKEDITEQVKGEDGEEEDIDMTDVPLKEESKKDFDSESEKKIKSSSSKNMNIPLSDALEISICCVCLMGPEEDNIIECDNCGITVHEGCYGATPTDPENDEIDTTWFCEPCVANVDEHQCELCPNESGVMKHTDSGKFAHMVCALYSDGIGFNDTTKLEPIITTDIPPSKFGYKKCDLCEDSRFAYTGLVVECDAGLCKSNFHITCAQKMGYLMENSSSDVKTNPFFAYCKVHVDKELARFNKKYYRLLQEHLRAFRSQKVQSHTKQLLEKRRKEHLAVRSEVIVPAIMTERHPRALFGSVSAFNKLTKKAELFGLDTHAKIIEETDFSEKTARLVRPAVSVEFAKQYEQRQSQREEVVYRYNYHYKNLLNLREEEHKLQAEIFELQNQVPKISKKYEKIRKQAVAIWKFLSIVEPSDYDIPDCLMQKQNIKIKSHVINRKIGLKYCQLCKRADNLESMVDCDECRGWFHFSCLDPPVKRNPKVNKKWAWFCTACTLNENEAQETSEAEDNGIYEEHEVREETASKSKSTKFGRTVKKPDHYKSDEQESKDKAAAQTEISPKKSDSSENVVALNTTEETPCKKCHKTDSIQKIFCDFCKKHYHLHCTSGSYESSSFICNACEALTANVPSLESKDSQEKLKDTLESDITKSQKRSNIFELQYNLLCQKRKLEEHNDPEEHKNKKLCNLEPPTVEMKSVTETSASTAPVPETQQSESRFQELKPSVLSPTKQPIFSTLMKGIPKTTPKVPEEAKKGANSLKAVTILEESTCSEAGDVVPVIIQVNETTTDSNQTVLTILPSDLQGPDSKNQDDSDGSLPDVMGS